MPELNLPDIKARLYAASSQEIEGLSEMERTVRFWKLYEHGPEDMAALIAEVERLQARVTELEADLKGRAEIQAWLGETRTDSAPEVEK